MWLVSRALHLRGGQSGDLTGFERGQVLGLHGGDLRSAVSAATCGAVVRARAWALVKRDDLGWW
jgi:hypothetical protein